MASVGMALPTYGAFPGGAWNLPFDAWTVLDGRSRREDAPPTTRSARPSVSAPT